MFLISCPAENEKPVPGKLLIDAQALMFLISCPAESEDPVPGKLSIDSQPYALNFVPS
jgi:hypothetical protein